MTGLLRVVSVCIHITGDSRCIAIATSAQYSTITPRKLWALCYPYRSSPVAPVLSVVRYAPAA